MEIQSNYEITFDAIEIRSILGECLVICLTI